ncbi:MAG TPA: glycosyltransferase [Candidatus Acidoferrales bacterium]|nr:glycosyltransferase [Candidatus Acidoferrales bacterium]
MKLVIFGLTITSSWGNGHATLLRGLCRALARRGHRVVFFERDVPYYAMHRDLWELPGVEIRLYPEWTDALPLARQELRDADAGIVTSYCPDGIAASDLVLNLDLPQRVFYDLDTPVTLERLRAGQPIAYVEARRLREFDLVLSYAGGGALRELRERLGVKRAAPLYGSADPEVHRTVEATAQYRGDLSYLGTYAEDRQAALEALFIEPARRMPERRFVIGGASYPQAFPWCANVYFVRHLPPREHAAFFCSSKLTLNVTRRPMAALGYCPSGRLFEAASCGVPMLSDCWAGMDQFFEPGREILIARDTQEAMEMIAAPPERLAKIGAAARRRTLECHTADHRAVELERILEDASSGNAMPQGMHPVEMNRRAAEA